MQRRKITRSQFLGTSLGLPLLTASALRNMGPFNTHSSSRETYTMNERIKSAREAGLKILNPGKKDLEHGLELHRNSVVVETYGFMPRAAFDGAAIDKAVKSGASLLEVHDLEEDMLMTRFAINERERTEFKNAWEASGVTCVFQNAGEESNDIKVLIKRLASFNYATDMMPDFVRKAVLPAQ